ncbi:hypothetical protein EJF36_21115 [Bacillus sp. HMF5848]|uniref:YkvI family membrane protein n=1 Tax=Bacillus sp. HMF5848 TaxID=2495421 RepID=UPI000F7A5C73|nr:hypothetical protein [Bacillus sp. HMF5848]RSK29184.1 hypothetical protein EJF36_21115 [Bacillus sp. HMF5848]
MIKAGLKWLFLILGTMIGAGYASGRELWQFFGRESGLAILLFSIVFIICCYVIMKISYEKQSEHFLPVLEELIGVKLSRVYDVIILLYLFTTCVVMLAGGGATVDIFSISYKIGILMFVGFLVLLFVWDIQGLISLNSLILPLLIICLLGALSYFLFHNQQPWVLDWHAQSNWPSAFTFTALNVLPLVAVLAAIGKEIKHVGEIWIASLGSGIILGLISFIYNQSLLQIAEKIVLYEIPLFGIIENFPYPMIIGMSFLLWFAIFTTAASSMFGLVTRFRRIIPLPLWIMAFMFSVLMIPLTSFGFSKLVAILYPIYGIINLYLLAALLIYPIANRYNIE